MTHHPSTGITKPALLKALKSTFGFLEFRPNQEEIITRILAGDDVFSVMPTGGGKSLCYQLPATLLPGMTVVISPLIALMKDQVDAARRNGIAAAFLNSSLATSERASLFNQLRAGEIKLLYIAPERLAMTDFQETLSKVPLAFFAVDEAHCISEWGHEFREEYLKLSVIRQRFAAAPIAAFTATATETVQTDTVARLGLRSPMMVRASFNRQNLYLEVKAKATVNEQVLDFVRGRPGQSGIVYRRTRASVEQTATFLSGHGFAAKAYHAGMESDERSVVQDAFQQDEVQTIVATVAFGMGIDKPDIRYVVHADLPKNIESYYQEIGRAGRDGDAAHCLLLFSPGDVAKIGGALRRSAEESPEQLAPRLPIALEKLQAMAGYAAHNQCRRRQILSYFGEAMTEENCQACDVCTGDVELADATIDSQILLSAVARTRQRFGATYITDIVVGADTERIRQRGDDQIKTYGAGKNKPRGYWRGLINDLLTQDFLATEELEMRSGAPASILKLTSRGVELLKGGHSVTILKRQEPKKKRRAFAADEDQDYNVDLFECLRQLRTRLAKQEGVPPFMIFSDRTLREMSRRRPTNLDAMAGIYGVGQAKLARYGELFAAEVVQHLNSH